MKGKLILAAFMALFFDAVNAGHCLKVEGGEDYCPPHRPVPGAGTAVGGGAAIIIDFDSILDKDHSLWIEAENESIRNGEMLK